MLDGAQIASDPAGGHRHEAQAPIAHGEGALGEVGARHHFDAQLLHQLAHEGLGVGLAGLDLAAGQLPTAGLGLAWAALGDEQATLVDDSGGDDADLRHGGALTAAGWERPMTDPREAHYEALLADVPTWDAAVQARYEATGEAGVDALLQSRAEVAALCAFIERHRVRRWLELGAWTGRLSQTLHRLFDFELCAVADDGYAARFGLPSHAPPDAKVFIGNSRSAAYRAFREGLGAVDLVFIDADHRYAGVKADFERERALPHRFLALHDITGSNRHTVGVARLWSELDPACTTDLRRPHVELGLPHSTMGIGIWQAG